MSPRVLSCAAVLLSALAVLVWAFQDEPTPAPARAATAQQPPVQPLRAQAPSPQERQEEHDTEMQPGAATAARQAAQPWRAHFLVIDEERRPVAGALVRVWTVLPTAPLIPLDRAGGPAALSAETDRDGRALVRVACRSLVVMAAKAEAGRSNYVDVKHSGDDVDCMLVLEQPVSITGRVLHDDGTPFSGILVVARPEAEILPGPGVFGPGEQDLFGARHAVRSSLGDGSFLLTVHPGTSWAIRAFPRDDTWWLWSEQPGVAAGSRDVTVYVSAAAAAGCIVHGRVTGQDGAPVRDYRVDLVYYRGSQPIGLSEVEVSVDGEHFTLPALTPGEQYGIHVGQKDGEGPLAPAIVDPFTATHTRLDLGFRLEPWGEIPVLVVDASGRVCQGLRAWCRCNLFHAESETDARTDGGGRALLPHCIPGLGTLSVFNGAEKLSEQELTVAPGRNAEVVVQLPPAGRR